MKSIASLTENPIDSFPSLPDSKSAWTCLSLDKQLRLRRNGHPVIFHYGASDAIQLAPVGTALLVFGRKGNPQLERLTKGFIGE